MSRKYFTKMENASADEMVFGQTKHPVKMGLDQVMGGGEFLTSK